MILQKGFEDPAAFRGGVLAIGNFDGVHRGHQKMLALLVGHAKKHGVPAVVLTFDPPPVQLLRPDAVPPRLTTLASKADLLAQSGVNCLIAYPTDRALLNLEPEEFFKQIVVEKIEARGMVEGPNFCFGRRRRGDVTLLAKLCQSAGLTLDVIEPELDGEDWISSSNIRRLIAEGDVSRAVQMMGHPYRLEGKVIPGEGRGRTLGFPTANLGKIATLLPADGVYASCATVSDTIYPAAVHVGANPTFGEQQKKVEVHLLEFTGDLYNQQLPVDLIGRVRGTQTFPSAETLRAQIEIDLAEVRRLANRTSDR